MTSYAKLMPVPRPTPAKGEAKVSTKEAHRKIRELTEAVARGHRVRSGNRSLEEEAFGSKGGGEGSNRGPR